jgi:hypothetical protein
MNHPAGGAGDQSPTDYRGPLATATVTALRCFATRQKIIIGSLLVKRPAEGLGLQRIDAGVEDSF